MQRLFLLLIVSSLGLAGCNLNPVKENQAMGTTPQPSAPPAESPAVAVDSTVEIRSQTPIAAPIANDVWQEIIRDYQLAAITHPHIEREITVFTRRTQSLERQLERGKPFLYHIIQQVSARGMPGEIALLPGIESGYRTTAYSVQILRH